MNEAVVPGESYKSLSEKFSKNHSKTSVLEPLSYKVAGCLSAASLKQKLQYRCFPTNYAKFLRTTFLREHL